MQLRTSEHSTVRNYRMSWHGICISDFLTISPFVPVGAAISIAVWPVQDDGPLGGPGSPNGPQTPAVARPLGRAGHGRQAARAWGHVGHMALRWVARRLGGSAARATSTTSPRQAPAPTSTAPTPCRATAPTAGTPWSRSSSARTYWRPTRHLLVLALCPSGPECFGRVRHKANRSVLVAPRTRIQLALSATRPEP